MSEIRFTIDRRTHQEQVKNERRQHVLGRRQEDAESLFIHRILLAILFTIIAVMGALAIHEYTQSKEFQLLDLGGAEHATHQ